MSDGEDPEPTDDPTIPVSEEVMAAAQRAALAAIEARGSAPKPGRRTVPDPGTETDRAEAPPRAPAPRLRGYAPEPEKVIVAGPAVHEPGLSVDVDFDEAAPPVGAPPPAPHPSLTDTVPEGPQRRRRLESSTVELPRSAFRATAPPAVPAADRTVLYVAIAISTIAALLLLANLVVR